MAREEGSIIEGGEAGRIEGEQGGHAREVGEPRTSTIPTAIAVVRANSRRSVARTAMYAVHSPTAASWSLAGFFTAVIDSTSFRCASS